MFVSLTGGTKTCCETINDESGGDQRVETVYRRCDNAWQDMKSRNRWVSYDEVDCFVENAARGRLNFRKSRAPAREFVCSYGRDRLIWRQLLLTKGIKCRCVVICRYEVVVLFEHFCVIPTFLG